MKTAKGIFAMKQSDGSSLIFGKQENEQDVTEVKDSSMNIKPAGGIVEDLIEKGLGHVLVERLAEQENNK